MSHGSSATDTSDASIQAWRYRLVPPVPALFRPMGLALATAILLLGAGLLKRRS
jgi:hypothetical protein